MRWGLLLFVACSSPAPISSSPPPPPPPPPAAVVVPSAIVAGAVHTCVLRDGSVWCWGNNENGQVTGDPGYLELAPYKVATGATAISAGYTSTCAQLATGLHCWGLERRYASTVQPHVFEAQKVVRVLPTAARTCAITTEGTVKCTRLPGEVFDVPGIKNAVELAYVQGDSCARTAAGLVSCWTSPTDVHAITDEAVALAGKDDHACYVARSGSVMCWGNNLRHQLGVDGKPDAPIAVPGIRDAIGVAVDERWRACAIHRDGGVSCWGDSEDKLVPPTRVSGLARVTALDLGLRHACAIAGGQVRCWGGDGLGQLGREPRHLHELRDPLPGVANVDELAAIEDSRFCARTGDRWRCWGTTYKSYYDRTRNPPADQPAFTGLLQIVTTWGATCQLRADRTVACSGENYNGATGDGTDTPRTTPFVIPKLADVVELAAGYASVCARTASGDVTCWGNNSNGQLGPNAKGKKLSTAVALPKPAPAVALNVHSDRTCILRASGPLDCYGSMFRRSNGPMEWLATATSIEQHGQLDCALLRDETVSCWGYNASGDAGDGTTKYHFDQPVAAIGLSKIVQLGDPCALTRDGDVWCWGRRERGIGLGDSFLDDCNTGDGPPWACVRTPTKLPISGVARLAFGLRTTCALMRDKTVRCWGDASGWPEPAPEPPVTITIP